MRALGVMTKFARSREALKVYDQEKPIILELFAKADTQQLLTLALAADATSVAKVREAFADDTKDINRRDQALLVHPDDPWLRRLMERE